MSLSFLLFITLFSVVGTELISALDWLLNQTPLGLARMSSGQLSTTCSISIFITIHMCTGMNSLLFKPQCLSSSEIPSSFQLSPAHPHAQATKLSGPRE